MKDTERRYSLSRWTNRRLRSLGFVSTFAVLAVAGACGGDSPSGPGASKPDGTYILSTVNGNGLPVAIFADTNYTYEVVSGSLTLTTGKFSMVTTFRQTVTGNVSTFVDSTGGTWVLTGTSVQFTNGEDGSTDTAALASGHLTFTEIDGTTTTTIVYARKS